MSKRKLADFDSELPEPSGHTSKRKPEPVASNAKSQKALKSFFKNIPLNYNVPVISRGNFSRDDFSDDQAHIVSWNIASSTVFDKGIITEFLATHKPDIMCLNEIKTDLEKIDKK